MNTRILDHILQHADPGITEIATHPSLYASPIEGEYRSEIDEKWLKSSGRSIELDALLDERPRHRIVTSQIILTQFSNIKD